MKNTIPTVVFRYSSIYNDMIGQKTYEPVRVDTYINKLENERRKYEQDILQAMQDITTLPRHEDKILCYIAHSVPFSDPLTIPMYPYIDTAVDTLTHECIHQLFIQGNNEKIAQKARRYFFDTYKDKEKNTIIHIPLHAIHAYIYTHVLKKPQKIEEEYQRIQKYYEPEYKQAYLDSRDIVNAEGCQKIIDIFTQKIEK